ncbi:DUF1878 domain-containing protein [Pseudalkalibacillus hwajinpoensis]|uniref:DUF1878 domain-containing protein n=1 Tax=Guptibacillus hwajinpoensis TaxID=208199 RepID=UPI00325AB1C5
MNNVAMVKRIAELEETIEMLLFRQDLLYSNTSIDRMLYEYQITKKQYHEIMALMDRYQEKILMKEPVDHRTFEKEIYHIVPEQSGDYQFVEYLTRVFWENDCWEDVFRELYEMELYY